MKSSTLQSCFSSSVIISASTVCGKWYQHLSCHGWGLTDASFSENFYGLKRRRRPYIETERATVAVGGIPSGEKLRTREIGRSLLFLVGIPYLRAKAQDYYEELGGGISSDIVNEGIDARQLRALGTDTVCIITLIPFTTQLTLYWIYRPSKPDFDAASKHFTPG